jgi:hypothetical protein
VAHNLGEAHVGHVFGAHDALLSCAGHGISAQSGKSRGGQSRAQLGNNPRAVVVARGLAGGEKDARIGMGSDAYDFIATVRGTSRRYDNGSGGICGGPCKALSGGAGEGKTMVRLRVCGKVNSFAFCASNLEPRSAHQYTTPPAMKG